MSRITYNKLVRDSIPKKIRDAGDVCEVSVLDDSAFATALRAKIVEEALELEKATTRDEILSEYADLTVVLDALTSLHEFSEADIKDALSRNIEKKGLLTEKYFLEWAESTKSNDTEK